VRWLVRLLRLCERGARLALVQLRRAASCWALITEPLAAQSDLCAQNLRARRSIGTARAISLIVRIVSLSAFLSRAEQRELSADEKWSRAAALSSACEELRESRAKFLRAAADNDINFPFVQK